MIAGGNMNFNDLKIFTSIFETQSLNKSAKSLGYAQSNITERLKIIESTFNSSFFVRSYNGVKPTPQGKEMYKFAIDTLNRLEKLQKDFRQEKNNILTSELLLNYAMNQENMLNIETDKIVIKKTGDISSEALKHNYKIIYSFKELNSSQGYKKEIRNLKSYYLCSEDLPVTKGLPLIVNSDLECPFRKESLKNYKIAHDKKYLEINSFANILDILQKGIGYSLLPDYLIDLKKLRKFSSEPVNIVFYVYKKKIY
ncbi:LysR family transcriptional regulator [Liquorilactobacillus hordei]|nr:LysR family transcriptional regulator [Liquorilactobacillus hordei]